MTDLEITLLDEIKNGNVKSFELVFKSYYPRLCKYAKSMIHDYDASSDIVKDVFIKWWEKSNSITVNTAISAYLYKSVHNSCINYIQRVLKNKVIFYESDLADSSNELISPASYDYQLAKLGTQELYTAIEQSINKLPDHCREIFILSRIKQKSHAEISNQLGISPNTVKVQIYRALLKLKKDLKDYLPILIILFAQQIFKN